MAIVDEIRTDPAASFWLRTAVPALEQRDPCDGLSDLNALVRVCRERLGLRPDLGDARYEALRDAAGLLRSGRAISPASALARTLITLADEH